MHFQLLLTICTPHTVHNLHRVEKTYIIFFIGRGYFHNETLEKSLAFHCLCSIQEWIHSSNCTIWS